MRHARGTRSRRRKAVGLALACLLGAATAQADAIVRSQAMRASTIAEYFIEDVIPLHIDLALLFALKQTVLQNLFGA